MKQQNFHRREMEVIHQIRNAHPTVGQMVLARKIANGEVASPTGRTATARPILSTYSVIRRYDAKRAAAVAN